MNADSKSDGPIAGSNEAFSANDMASFFPQKVPFQICLICNTLPQHILRVLVHAR